MSLANRITSLLTSLTDNQVSALSPVDRQLLQDQLERVYRMTKGARIEQDSREATAPKAAFVKELRDGRGRE